MPILHRAARIEDRIQEFREQRARKRGLLPTVIPYAGYGAPGWVRVLGRVMLTREPRSSRPSVRGWRSFTSVAVNDVNVIVTIGKTEHRVHADRGGVIDVRLKSRLSPGWRTVTIRSDDPESADGPAVEAPVYIVDGDAHFGIVSDIDDTVMVTALPRPFLAAWNTFVLDEHARTPTPGMAVLYDRLTKANPGTTTIYLSTGAWNVAPTLSRFLGRNLYPRGPLLLTDWGPTHDRIFRSGRQHKVESLARLATEFPDVKWLLIGDDGQHDEEIYGEFALAHPDKVRAVAIRQLSSGEAVLAGGRTKAEDYSSRTEVPWIYGPDGAAIASELERIGVL
ncbi:App1 family protein [Amnibacterium flavum]|uniref:ACP synthase n=1 Tax=Amnibacterium flavum TaxID=2173173 RepID=A0A2V1HV35_9MICO|nr:phosphatase domain-containing protein [Amnibacterium flavum]PVZ94879.1 ACP synthase [Amnibacterium flavum]